MVRIARLDDAFSGILELEASPVEGESLQQKGYKKRKRKGEEGHFLVYLKILISVHARAKMHKT